ncbi:uncharacterized protein LOC141912850, partial [Tubulanus polymorphus]|uniref:uncharacterized protein LOC141912850 n=1 Tax=Tubulanus polymorphus TaxID=672921 RepID=UPI003DA4A55A
SVGPDNIPGFEKVQQLADYLVDLRQCPVLTNVQARKIVSLWNNLDPYDKKSTKFSPRHKTKLTQGRFKVSKTNVLPGVESTRRCFIGENGSPAQWPDCNRYVEALISRLCDLHPGMTRTKSGTTQRWTLVMKTYRSIRDKVMSNGLVVNGCNIQLVEINNTTLSQWYNKRSKRKETVVLQQGITLPTPPLTTDTIRDAVLRQAIPIPPPTAQHFQFNNPENDAGKAKTRDSGVNILPKQPPLPLHLPVTIVPAGPCTMTPVIQSVLSVPSTTQWYRKRQLHKAESGESVKKYHDTNVFASGSDIHHLALTVSSELDKLATWFYANKLSLNLLKTHCMVDPKLTCHYGCVCVRACVRAYA